MSERLRKGELQTGNALRALAPPLLCLPPPLFNQVDPLHLFLSGSIVPPGRALSLQPDGGYNEGEACECQDKARSACAIAGATEHALFASFGDVCQFSLHERGSGLRLVQPIGLASDDCKLNGERTHERFEWHLVELAGLDYGLDDMRVAVRGHTLSCCADRATPRI